MKATFQTFSLLLVCLFISINAEAQDFPNLTATDINGVSHDLQADYLDQGIPVLVHFFAAWNIWDEFFMDTMSMQAVFNDYGPNGSAQVMMLAFEIDPSSSNEDLENGTNGSIADWPNLINYPIINLDDPTWGTETMGVFAMPSLALFCPDGTIYGNSTVGGPPNYPYVETEDMTYGNFLSVNGITDAFENLCGTMINDENVSGYSTLNIDACSVNLDNPLKGTIVTFTDGTNVQMRTANQQGRYEAFLANGTYDMTFENSSSLMSICDAPTSVTVNNDITTDLDVIYDADILCPEITLTLNPWLLRPCDLTSFVQFEICNIGTVDLSAYTATLQFPVGSDIIATNTMDPYTFDVGTGVLQYSLSELEMGACKNIQIGFRTPCPTNAGDTLCFDLSTDPIQIYPNCDEYIQSEVESCQVAVASYDPNDKNGLTLGNGPLNFVDAGTELTYMIRFQNTGTDTAFTVRIDDPMSSVFDVSTIRPLDASHDYVMNYSDGMLSFLFPDIKLVDSLKNEPLSHGFITYRVTLRESLAPGTAIDNYANIYFDSNEPILTNTYQYQVTVLSHTTDYSGLDIQVYPNPAQSQITINMEELGNKKIKLEILDLQGRILAGQSEVVEKATMNVGELISGMYYIQIRDQKTNELISLQKFVKE